MNEPIWSKPLIYTCPNCNKKIYDYTWNILAVVCECGYIIPSVVITTTSIGVS